MLLCHCQALRALVSRPFRLTAFARLSRLCKEPEGDPPRAALSARAKDPQIEGMRPRTTRQQG